METHMLYYISRSPYSEHVKQQKQQFGDDKISPKHTAAENNKTCYRSCSFHSI